MLLAVDAKAGDIILAEVSFRTKLHILSSLVRERALTRRFNVGSEDAIEVFSELASLCFRAEEMRNRIMHSSWESVPGYSETITRRKITAKAGHGLRTQSETLDGGKILDIADFTANVCVFLEEFFIPMDDDSTSA